MKCGRCDCPLLPYVFETCWFCEGKLCPACWDSVGHCGHPEANKINEESRKTDSVGRAELIKDLDKKRSIQ